MISCPGATPAPLRCPTLLETLQETIAHMPRGRAWPANDGGGALARFLAWLAGLNGSTPARSEWPAGHVQTGFFAAVGAVFNFIETRICDLRLEFWCATQSETRDQWMLEYGLPDACDPFPDLCAKVAAIGGTRCEYYAAVASRAGWTIECNDEAQFCGASAGCLQAGCSFPGGAVSSRLQIIVDLGASSAYGGPFNGVPRAGCFAAGSPLGCEPDITALRCILARIVHAEIAVDYVTIAPPIYIMADAFTHIMDNTGALLVAE